MIPWMVAGLEPAQTFVELFQQLCAGSVVKINFRSIIRHRAHAHGLVVNNER